MQRSRITSPKVSEVQCVTNVGAVSLADIGIEGKPHLLLSSGSDGRRFLNATYNKVCVQMHVV